MHEIVHSSLPSTNGDTQQAAAIATDSAGNHIIGSILRYSGPGTPTIRSLISKFDRSNHLVWQRERTVSFDDTGYYEQWGDGQAPQPALGGSGILSVEVARIAVDGQDNVVIAFNTFQPDYNNGVQSLIRSKVTMLAKFDASGQFIWRRATPDNIIDPSNVPPYYVASLVKSFAVSADGSLLTLVHNFSVGDGHNYHQSVAFKIGADGTRVFANHYGADSQANFQFMSTPIALAQDGAANLYLVSTESPDVQTSPRPDQFVNVVRKLDPNGNALGEKDVLLYPGTAAGSTLYTQETWSAARADAAGNLYVGGDRFRIRLSSSDPDQGEAKQLLLKFNPDLSQAWRSLGPQATGRFVDQPHVTVVDLQLSAGGVTVGGYWSNTGTGASQNDYHWELTRYAAGDGHLIWHRLYQSTTSDPNQGWEDTLNAFRLDSAGNVYASGVVSKDPGVRQALIKYSDAGDLQFVKLFPDNYISLQAASLTLPAATSRPTFFGTDQFDNAQVIVIEFDNPAVVAGQPDVFGNISTRVRVGAGDNVLIGGFIVTGAQGSMKKVLVRAIGPSVAAAGVSGALPDTVLTLHDSQGNTHTNDNWKGDPGQPSQRDEIAATGIAPSDDRESAIIVSVPAGGTTAIVQGKTDPNTGMTATGTALVEVYDLEQSSAVQLANISTRGKVEADNDPMIAGIIVLGANPQDILFRAIAPSLAASGVANTLQDPALWIYDGNGVAVASNDDWHDQSGNPQGGDVSVLPPSDDREAALRITLLPAPYTAIVRAADKAPPDQKTGVALVEAYHLQ